eukprot:344941-Pyramimonas_sp.AAC.1
MIGKSKHAANRLLQKRYSTRVLLQQWSTTVLCITALMLAQQALEYYSISVPVVALQYSYNTNRFTVLLLQNYNTTSPTTEQEL